MSWSEEMERERISLEQSQSQETIYALALLMEQLGATQVRFDRRLILWGMSGTTIYRQWDASGNLTVTLVPTGDYGIKGAVPVCPWPFQESKPKSEV